MSHSVIGAIATVAFWMFITIVSVAGIMYDYRKKRLVIDTVRHAVEHGAPRRRARRADRPRAR